MYLNESGLACVVYEIEELFDAWKGYGVSQEARK